MELVLYTPGLGYYSAGAKKLGADGDFVTAPEITPLFGKYLAKQIAEVLMHMPEGNILELGAGSGRLAVDILMALAELNHLPQHYYILEVSADLKARQQAYIAQNIPQYVDRVSWLDRLPTQFSGVILANEVLDAMPVHRFYQDQKEIKESWITIQENKFVERFDQASAAVMAAVSDLGMPLNEGYTSEISLIIPAWIHSLSDSLKKGLILLIDYGFAQREYYHPQRYMGTLRCHYRHHVHDDFFLYPGLQDLTAHVNFTQVASSALNAGLNVAGYTTQAHFLMNCGVMDFVSSMNANVIEAYQMSQSIKKLLLPSEMGELFKVMALSKEITLPLLGFNMQDMRHRL